MLENVSLAEVWTVSIVSLLLAAALYVWTAAALAAVFGKIGPERWKAWVPIVNQITLLMVAGLSGWLFLLILIPGLGGLALWIATIVAAHRIGRGFGAGPGMTVLAALLFPVWATVLGFGSAVWRGSADTAGQPAYARSAPAAPAEPAAAYPPPPPPPPAPRPPARAVAPVPPPTAPPITQPIAVSWAPPTTPRRPGDAAPHDPASDDAVARRATADQPVFDEWWASEVDEVSAIAQPAQGSPVAARPVATGLPALADTSEPHPGRQRGAADAPAPAVSRPAPASGADAATDSPAQAPAAEAAAYAPPAVTRPPASPARVPAIDPEPQPGPDLPLEVADEVSAVVGAPVAGAPRSALTSVSAVQAASEEEEFADQTVVARRRRIAWTLQPTDGLAIDLTSEVVIVGRQPSADPVRPRAQLVAVPDSTRTVSKTHARLELQGDRWVITDLGSTNGVFLATLMGTEIEAEPGAELAPGERFLLGDATFRLERSDR